MRIEGTLRSNLIAAIASARRLRGQRVHGDTLNHWHRLLDHARQVASQPLPEACGDLITQLETELNQSRT